MPSEPSEREDEPDYARHYLSFNDLSDANYKATGDWYEKLLAPVLGDLPKASRILDIGCGAGLLINALQRMGFTNASGVDASQSMAALAQARGLPVRHVPDDYVETLPADAHDTYDAIFLLDVLEHVPVCRQLAFVRGIRRLLCQNGRLIVSVPNASSVLAARWRFIDWTHTSAFTEHSLRFVLLNSGFSKVNFLPHEFFGRPRMPFLPRRGAFYWWLHCLARGLWRLQVVAELGREGWKIPLSLNLLAVAVAGSEAISRGNEGAAAP